MEILLPCTILLLLLPLSFSRFPLAVADDTTALSVFRSETDIHGILLSNWTLLNSSSGADACSASWRGVRCSGGRVISLALPSLDLRGPIDALSSLGHLRLLDLHANRLNGTLDRIFNCTGLKLLYLSGNDFSGGISPTISSLRRLVRLDLSNNNLRGPIPSEIGNLSRLMTLRLQNNELSGPIPASLSSIQTLQQLNLTNNEFYGHLPENLQRRFGDQSFSGNAGLCGPNPLPICSLTGTPPEAASAQTVPSNPSSLPASTTIIDETEKRKHRGLSPGAIAAIVISNSLIFLAMASFVVAYYCRTRSSETYSQTGSERGGGKRRSSSFSGGEKRVYAARSGGADSDGTTASDRSRLVFYDKKKQFELEDLLRASAEMLGKGSLGTVYKAVLDDGYAVAVKRLKDANPCARKEFEQYMDVIGNLKHPNIVRLRGYYYAKEEKLLVYDYLTNGSLHSLLHGNRGPGRIPLDWTTRISLVLGAARGLSRIHEEYSVTKIPHGNVKSSNILLDKNGVTCISDFGLSLLLNPAHAVARLGGYRAPEQAEVKKLSQKSDVYSFGVLLLEVLTGKLPSRNLSPKRHQKHVEAEEDEIEAMDLPKWVKSVVRDEWTGEVFDQELLRYKNIEGEMVAMLQVSLACVAEQPEERPTMTDVVKMIEEIRVENSPLAEDYDESRSSLSPSMAATEEGPAGY